MTCKRSKIFNNIPRKKRNTSTGTQLRLEIPEEKDIGEIEYGNDWIDVEINLVTNNDAICTEFQNINVYTQLLYRNGDMTNNVMYNTIPNNIVMCDGVCNFKIKINTLSLYHLNRDFKLVFSTDPNETGKHINDYTTNSFKLVQYKVHITEEPKDIFYKDDGGKTKNFLVYKGCIKDCYGNLLNKRIKYDVKLLYDNYETPKKTKTKTNKNVLEILNKNKVLNNGKFMVKYRINDVSKNHNDKKFRILVEFSDDKIENITSKSVFVKSKVPKKKTNKNKIRKSNRNNDNNNSVSSYDNKSYISNNTRNSHNTGNNSININDNSDEDIDIKIEKKKIYIDNIYQNDVVNNMLEWCNDAYKMFKKLEWKLSGYEIDPLTGNIDMNKPLHRCSQCGSYKDVCNIGKHRDGCELRSLMNSFNIKVKSLGMTNVINNINNNKFSSNNIDLDDMTLNPNGMDGIKDEMRLPAKLEDVKSVKKVKSGERYGLNPNMHEVYGYNNELLGLMDFDDNIFIDKTE